MENTDGFKYKKMTVLVGISRIRFYIFKVRYHKQLSDSSYCRK